MENNFARKPKIFLGANNLAYGLVKWLTTQLINMDRAIPVEIGSIDATENTLATMVEKCKECDFAVLFLTKDVVKKFPQNNAIFEAGFFAGGLGLEPERCILVSSVPDLSLPSAIYGVRLVTIDEPPPPEPPFGNISDEWCTLNLQVVLKNINTVIDKYGELLTRPSLKILSKQQLAEREQIGDDCLENFGKVVINNEPDDCCDFFLSQVAAKNMKSHIDYDYNVSILEGNEQYACSKMIDLLRILFISYYQPDTNFTEGDLQSEANIMRFLRSKAEDKTLLNAIEDFKKHLRFTVQKKVQRIPFRMIVHNAHIYDKAKCYLRHDDYYIEWFTKKEAADIPDISTKDYRLHGNRKVFQNSSTVNIYDSNTAGEGEKIRKILMQKITEMFPDVLWDTIKTLCFGEADFS